MSRLFLLTAYFTFMVACVGISGCGAPADSGGGSGASTDSHDHDGDHDHDEGDHDHDGDHDHGDEGASADKIKVNLAKLSDEDRTIAIKQVSCPVGGDALGGMGVPIKVDVDGQAVFICCEACKEDLLENKEKYLAIIDGGAKKEG